MAAGASPVSQTRVLLGLVLGAALGSAANVLVGEENYPGAKPALDLFVKYVAGPVGQIFLNLLFLAIVPLVFASLAVGVTRLGGSADVGRVGARTLTNFVITTLFASVIGLTLVNVIQPGKRLAEDQRVRLLENYPRNADAAAAKPPGFGIETVVAFVPRNPFKSVVEMDMIPIIVTALLVGVGLTRIDPDKAAALADVLEAVNQITGFIIRLAMSLAPYAVFALIFQTTAEFGYRLLIALGAFVATVLSGLAIHQFLVLPLLVVVLCRLDPVWFFKQVWVVMVTAFSTSSSSATLPAAMRCAEESMGVPPKISRFVLPLGASMNHNGTALFEAVTVLFLAQLFNFDLSLSQQVVVIVLCILTATGMAGGAGRVAAGHRRDPDDRDRRAGAGDGDCDYLRRGPPPRHVPHDGERDGGHDDGALRDAARGGDGYSGNTGRSADPGRAIKAAVMCFSSVPRRTTKGTGDPGR